MSKTKILTFLQEIFPGYSNDVLWSIYRHTNSLDKTVNKLLEMNYEINPIPTAIPDKIDQKQSQVSKTERRNIIMSIRSKLRSFKKQKKYTLLEFDDLNTLE